MLFPLVSFAYAHFYDYVQKRYKIHVGSVEVDVIYFHVDHARMIDVNNNGIIFGDELKIDIYEDPETCTWFVDIIADPIPSGFVLNTTLKLHVSGKLPVRFNYAEGDYGCYWAGPFDYSWPDFNDPTLVWKDISTLPGVMDPTEGPWSYEEKKFYENGTGTYPVPGSTQMEYKPCWNITIKQHINFRQPGTVMGEKWTQKDWQCNRILIRCWWQFIEENPQEISCFTWPPPPPQD